MNAEHESHADAQYLGIILNRLLVSKEYKPKFGQGEAITLEKFKQLYGSDPFYHWFGLNDPLVYAAHSAAGGITSIYRQIGLGCEELFRQLLQDHLGLTESQTKWSYVTETATGRQRKLSLDGCIQLSNIAVEQKRGVVSSWLHQAAEMLNVAPEIIQALQGIVFEVRQGYKSKDSKRQNADMANAATAYSQGYLPVLLVLSTQIDSDIVERYHIGKWFILQGQLIDSPFTSTYAFSKDIIGYDLAGFFQRSATTLQATIADILRVLLKTETVDD